MEERDQLGENDRQNKEKRTMRYTTRITTIRVTEHSTLSGMTELGQF
jgi:hypothetical protein